MAGGSAGAIELEILPGRVEGPLDPAALFGRKAPLEIEIGIGKGRFILEEAALRPATDFLGLEWSLKHLRLAKERAAKRGLTNVRFHRADAKHVLADLLPSLSAERVHVYCPDPWPKTRHHKRRLFDAATTRHLERVLRPGGFLHVSTDVRDYFEVIVATVAGATALRPAEDPLFPAGDGDGKTNYETKYLLAGRRIHRAAFQKPAER
jgi:tRNA (guanine-N7-)-methyltransferase